MQLLYKVELLSFSLAIPFVEEVLNTLVFSEQGAIHPTGTGMYNHSQD